MVTGHRDGLLKFLVWSPHSVCWRFGSRDNGLESCFQHRKTNCLFSIRNSLACSELTTTHMHIGLYFVEHKRPRTKTVWFTYRLTTISLRLRWLCCWLALTQITAVSNKDLIHKHMFCILDMWLSLKVCLTHWGRDKTMVIFQTTFSNAFS